MKYSPLWFHMPQKDDASVNYPDKTDNTLGNII